MTRRSAARALAAAMLLVIVASNATLAAGVTWSPAVAVGPEQRAACANALATSATTSGVTLHAAYHRYAASAGDHGSVYYRRSRDAGATWPTGATITSSSAGYKVCPVVAASGSLVVVAWRQETATAAAIRLRVSSDGGTTWGQERRLPTTRTPGVPSVAISGTRIIVGWTDGSVAITDGSGSTYWSRIALSGDRGIHWTLRTLDAQPTAYGTRTQVASSGNRVFVAWMRVGGTRIIGRVSTNAGSTWQAPAGVATTFAPMKMPGVSGKLSSSFAIAARPDRMAIAWTGPWTADRTDVPSLFVRVFAGGTWQAPSEIVDGPPVTDIYPYGYTSTPAVTLLANTRVGVAWSVCHDFRTAEYPFDDCGEIYGGNDDARWAESSNNGVSWTGSVILDPNATYTTIWAMSAVWVSADLRGVLITEVAGEPDWDLHLRFVRGRGLP